MGLSIKFNLNSIYKTEVRDYLTINMNSIMTDSLTVEQQQAEQQLNNQNCLSTIKNSSVTSTVHKHPKLNKCIQTKLGRSIGLKSSSGMIYKEVKSLKKAKYGEVIQAKRYNQSLTNPLLYTSQGFVAIKKYLKSEMYFNLSRNSQENPLNEMYFLQKVSLLCNDNIIKVYECMEDASYYYMVLSYNSSVDLVDFITSNGSFTEENAKNFFLQLMNGLQALHSLGIAHRDLTSENILVDSENNRFSIIDLGACVELERSSSTESGYKESMNSLPIFGKKNYIAPEVNSQESVFYPLKVDIWSCGVILFIALAGYPPMDEATSRDPRFRMIVQGKLESLIKNWNISSKFNSLSIDLINKMLSFDPRDRPSVEEILNHPWLRSARGQSTQYIISSTAPQA